jgi:hypothetical protein
MCLNILHWHGERGEFSHAATAAVLLLFPSRSIRSLPASIAIQGKGGKAFALTP